MKRLARRIIGAIGATAMMLGSAGAAEYEWKMATIAPENSVVFNLFVKGFTDRVKAYTGGRIEITPYGAGVLAHPFKVFEAVQDGTVDFGWSYAGFLVNADPTNAMFSGFPGGMGPEPFMHWYFTGGGQALFEKYRRDQMGLQTFYSGQGTTEIFAHSHKPVRTREDLVGYKHRTAGAWAAILKDTFGGAPTVTDFSEIFGMLQQKAIDGVEYAGPGGNLALGYHKVAKYIILPGVHQPGTVNEMFMKAERYDALPDELKFALQEAARMTVFNSYLGLGGLDQEAMAEYRAGGNEIVMMEPALVEEIKAAGQQWMRAQVDRMDAEGKPWTSEIWASYKAYHDNWAKNAFTRTWDVE
jgi:TRAP-type mannitol/chloroaromatic compound transport system substrate-binding protein